jgi:phosphoribosylaminoimidazolecarboxamide formyltransferase/IMP cyclohydrolase
VGEVRRALLSVSDKNGLVDLARGLAELGVELVSTGGTARALTAAGLAVREVAEVTGFPEMLDGRVKTLHPSIHGGILARRDVPAHQQALATHGIGAIDLVAVNLYPFEATVAKEGIGFEEAIEQIDVGGPAMIRAAAKNHAGVVVLVDPGQYVPVLEELRRSGGTVSPETRQRLALEAFRRTAQYDAAIAAWLRMPAAATGPVAGDALRFPPVLHLDAERMASLRYGENPHQRAAFYRPVGPALGTGGLGALRQLHGPDLSYNNLLDLAGALGLLVEFTEPAAVVVKHTNPCGAAVGSDVGTAFARARASDPVSIYGGVVGVNRPVDRARRCRHLAPQSGNHSLPAGEVHVNVLHFEQGSRRGSDVGCAFLVLDLAHCFAFSIAPSTRRQAARRPSPGAQPQMITSCCLTFLILIQSRRWPGW